MGTVRDLKCPDRIWVDGQRQDNSPPEFTSLYVTTYKSAENMNTKTTNTVLILHQKRQSHFWLCP
jgi:hypothetical protein